MNKNSLIKQAGILSIASIIVRMIGLLYRIPFSRIVGDLGNNYYGIAFNIYTILIILSGYSIPTAVSKLISEQLALKKYKNARRIFITTLIFVSIFGAILSILLYILTPYILPDSSKNATFALRTLAPTLFISGFIGTFQGYFQARKTTVPTAIAQILEQLLNALVSVLLAFILTRFAYGDTVQIATLGALGGTLGTLAGAITSIAILYAIYHACLPRYKRELKKDTSKNVISYKHSLRLILWMLVPLVLTGIATNITSLFAQYIYYDISEIKHINTLDFSIDYGIYIGKYFPIIGLPTSIAMSISTAGLPIVSQIYSTRNMHLLHKKFTDILTLNLFVTLPSAVGLFILANPIMQFLFPGTPIVGTYLLQLGTLGLLICSFSSILSNFLNGIGKQFYTLIISLISLVIFIITLVILMFISSLGILSILIAGFIQAMFIIIATLYVLKINTGYNLRILNQIKSMLIPNLIMAIIVFTSYKLVYLITHINSLATIISILLSTVAYLLINIKFNYIDLSLLRTNPIGKKVLAILNKK